MNISQGKRKQELQNILPELFAESVNQSIRFPAKLLMQSLSLAQKTFPDFPAVTF
jgi:hypothetical protein